MKIIRDAHLALCRNESLKKRVLIRMVKSKYGAMQYFSTLAHSKEEEYEEEQKNNGDMKKKEKEEKEEADVVRGVCSALMNDRSK